nr:hypothetical protein [Tanacetum cinerariifolium]
MSTQQDIYAAGSGSRLPMLNKENYVPWSSRLLRPNGKLIHNSILNGPYVRRMIPEPGDANCDVNMTETFHEQTDDELSEKELKQIEADDQAIQTIFLGLPEDIYAAVDSCETAQEIWLRVQQMMKGSDIGFQKKKAKLFNEWERFTSNEGESIESYYHQWSRHVTIVHQTKDLHTADYTQLYDFLKYNLKEVDELKANDLQRFKIPLHSWQIPTIMVGGNGGNQFRQYAGNLNAHNAVQNDENQIGNGNLVAVYAKGNAAGHNGNQIRCYNCRGLGHFARDYTIRPRRRDVAYLQTQLLIAQKEETGIQLQAEEYDLMAAAADLDEIEELVLKVVLLCLTKRTMCHGRLVFSDNELSDKELKQIKADDQAIQTILLAADLDEIEKVNANCILMANLQQASTSAKVHENCDDNEIFNMFTQEEQYTKLLKPIPESHQVPQNDNDVISKDTSVEQDLNKQLSKEKSTISFLLEEKKKFKSDFKTREDKLLDKQIQLEKKIKELNNILVKTGQSIQTIHMLSIKPDSFYHTK